MGLRQKCLQFAFRLSRGRFAGLLVGWVFAHMSFAVPVDRLRQTQTLLAFHHPKPVYPLHILIVPRKSIAGLHALGSEDQDFLLDLFTVVQNLVEEFDLQECGYRLIANGGNYQDIPLLHFHLVSGDSA